MDSATKSLIILTVAGIISSGLWIVFLAFPTNPFVVKVLQVDEATWVPVDIAVLATAANVHIHHRMSD